MTFLSNTPNTALLVEGASTDAVPADHHTAMPHDRYIFLLRLTVAFLLPLLVRKVRKSNTLWHFDHPCFVRMYLGV
jgi:hypothetical protein